MRTRGRGLGDVDEKSPRGCGLTCDLWRKIVSSLDLSEIGWFCSRWFLA